MWVSTANKQRPRFSPPHRPRCSIIIRKPSRPFGAEQHDRPGAAAHQEQSARRREDAAGGGEAVCSRERHRLQRLRGAGSSRHRQGEDPTFRSRGGCL